MVMKELRELFDMPAGPELDFWIETFFFQPITPDDQGNWLIKTEDGWRHPRQFSTNSGLWSELERAAGVVIEQGTEKKQGRYAEVNREHKRFRRFDNPIALAGCRAVIWQKGYFEQLGAVPDWPEPENISNAKR
jgi:hypothetical protein